MKHRVIPIVRAETLIPDGLYCYTTLSISPEGRMAIRSCPFWEPYNAQVHGPLPAEYADGLGPDGTAALAYCRHLKAGDWMENGTMLLWDQVKECGIKDHDLDPDPLTPAKVESLLSTED